MNHELGIKNKVFKNHKSSIINQSQHGFTLIEILVTMTVLLAVGSILISILISSLRGTNKVNSIDNVRRNGNYALEQMGKMIRYSQSFDGVSDDPNGVFTTKCTPPVVAVTPTPTPSVYHYVKITGFDGGKTTLSCLSAGDPGGPKIASTSAAGTVDFIDTISASSTVEIDSCSITCTQSTVVSPPTVTIQFSLSNKTSSELLENQASVPFQTSVTVRNF